MSDVTVATKQGSDLANNQIQPLKRASQDPTKDQIQPAKRQKEDLIAAESVEFVDEERARLEAFFARFFDPNRPVVKKKEPKGNMYCMVCHDFTDHKFDSCPDKATKCIVINGAYVVNYCYQCHVYGHMECSKIDDIDVGLGSPGTP